MKKSVLIIGGGIGGLVCGAILSKEGFFVRVLEKHTVAGGGLHTFKRRGVEFETGMHLISGFQPNGVLNKLFSYLGVADQLNINPANDDGFDHFHVAADGMTYKMARGRDNFVKTLSHYFPEETENIKSYEIENMKGIIVAVRKERETNLKYPRRYARIKNKPL